MQAQATAADLPLEEIFLPDPCPNDVYEEVMGAFIERVRAQGVTNVVFGDLFLEDIRKYREDKLWGTGFEPLFPLWQIDTTELAQAMIAGGLKAYIVSIDTEQLDGRFIGRAFDETLLANLPPGCDPCGKNGEFHTVTVAGPNEYPVRLYWNRSPRCGAIHSAGERHVIITDRTMLGLRIIPNEDIARLPVVAVRKLGVIDVFEQLFE